MKGLRAEKGWVICKDTLSGPLPCNLFNLPEYESSVGSAEAEGVGHGNTNFLFFWPGVRGTIRVALKGLIAEHLLSVGLSRPSWKGPDITASTPPAAPRGGDLS